MVQELTFAIYPDGEAVSIGLFEKTIQDIHRLVRDVDYAVTKERGIRRWIITQLHSSVPTITLQPLLDSGDTARVLMGGIRTVTLGSQEPPAYFTEQALEDLKRMRRLFTGRDRAKRLEVSHNHGESATIRDDIADKTEQILMGGYWNLGSIEGMLEAINLHGNPTFTIWDRVSRYPVRCRFPKELPWKEKVKSLLEKRVLVSGKVNYFRNGIPRSITSIEAIDDATPSADLPKATYGSIPRDEGTRDDVVTFLHKLRGDKS